MAAHPKDTEGIVVAMTVRQAAHARPFAPWRATGRLVVALLALGAAPLRCAPPAADDAAGEAIEHALAESAVPGWDYASVEAFARALGELAHDLIDWIGEHSDHDTAPTLADPPSIVFARAGDRLRIGEDVLHFRTTTRGAYAARANVIVLALPWKLGVTRDTAALLHELVHAVQLSARDWNCPAETEWEAYRLQQRWLGEQGVELKLDWLRIGTLSHCPPQ